MPVRDEGSSLRAETKGALAPPAGRAIPTEERRRFADRVASQHRIAQRSKFRKRDAETALERSVRLRWGSKQIVTRELHAPLRIDTYVRAREKAALH